MKKICKFNLQLVIVFYLLLVMYSSPLILCFSNQWFENMTLKNVAKIKDSSF